MNTRCRVSVITLAVMCLAGRSVLAGTPATWDPTIHGGDDINYSDPNNWDISAVPINNGTTYDVTIPGSEVVAFDAGVSGDTVDTFTLGLGSTFNVNSGKTYNVLGLADIGGTVTVDASTFNAPSATALFSGRPLLFSQAGGLLNIGASSWSATYNANSQTIIQADNASITLGSLSSLTADENTSFIDTLTVHALNGGTIDLSALTSASSNDLLRFKTDSGGTINLFALTTTNNVRFEINGSSYTLNSLANTTGTQFDAGVGQTINADALLTHTGGSFNLQTGSVVNLAAMNSMRNTTFTAATGTTFNAPTLADVAGSVLTLDPTFTFTTSSLSNIDGTKIFVNSGLNFNRVTDDIYTGSFANNSETILRADGIGSSLNLSTLTSIVANETTSFIDVLTVHARNNGTIDLSNVTSASSNDILRFLVETGGSIDLSNLASVSRVEFEIDVPIYSVNALIQATSSTFDLKVGTTFNATSLTTMTGTTFVAGNGATFNAPSLVDVSGSTLNLDPSFTFNVGSLANINGSRLFIRDGLSFNLVSATSMSGTYAGSQTILQADGAGSLLNLSTLQSLTLDDNTSAIDTLTVHALNDGQINLSNITSATSNDILRFLVESGGSIDLTNLTSTTNVNFEVGTSSTQSAAALTTMVGGLVDLKPGATLDVGALTAMRNATFVAAGGAAFNAPNLTDVSGSTLNLDPGFTFSVGAISNIDGTHIFVSGGMNFNAVVATAMTGTYSGSQTILQADGAVSVLNLSTLQSLTLNDNTSGTDTLTVAARNGGKLDLSGVTNLSSNDQIQVLATSMGEIDLSALQSVTGTALFNVDAESTLKLGNFTVTGNTTFNINDATSIVQVAGSLLLDAPAVFNVATAGGVSIGGNFSFASQSESSFNMDDGILKMVGVGTFGSPQFLEVGGEDLGISDPNDPTAIPGIDGNFAIGQLVIGDPNQATVVELLDAIDNGNGPGLEALYLPGFGGDGLQIFGGSTLVLESINVYAFLDGAWIHLNSLFGGGVTSIPLSDLVSDPEANGFIVIPEPATIVLCLLAVSGCCGWRRGRGGGQAHFAPRTPQNEPVPDGSCAAKKPAV